MVKVNFISISPLYTTGTFTAAIFDDHVEVKHWPSRHPETEYELTFKDTVNEFVEKGATLVFTADKQVDVKRTLEAITFTELNDIKKEEK